MADFIEVIRSLIFDYLVPFANDIINFFTNLNDNIVALLACFPLFVSGAVIAATLIAVVSAIWKAILGG